MWCWHQHGWRHVNHEGRGKKQEFGDGRPTNALRRDLRAGHMRLAGIMGGELCRMFTPPWNRCSEKTLELLARLGYRAVSRTWEAKPVSERGLPDVPVNVDLHTRKAVRPHADWKALLKELETALAGGWCGIMLHHQRMNAFAFDFLGILLQHMVKHKHFRIVHLKTLL